MKSKFFGSANKFGKKRKLAPEERANPNPHNYPKFEIEGLTIYAINEPAAQEKAAKILRKKQKHVT